MIDVNIIADEDLSRLLALECKRFGLSHTVSESPIDGAKIYIAQSGFGGAQALPPQKTIFIGEEAEPFWHTLPNPFLLTEFRQILGSLLFGNCEKEEKPLKEKPKKTLPLSLDSKKRTATVRRNEIKLSPTEFKILSLLWERKGKVVTHGEIDELIGGSSSNKSNVYLCYLRKKLEAYGDKIILSVRGKGFMIK